MASVITVDELAIIIDAQTSGVKKQIAGLNDQLGGLDSTAKNSNGFQQLASKAATALAVAGAAAAAVIGGTAVASVKSFANYEQYVGGVETLFKSSADIVENYAKNAYETAGLSANRYMDQATSFSATLLQGLGGDTEKAAQYANKAIIDMSDNANKMGTDIGMIQNAYQGFAKDNFMMLDNLKLGYGGTAGEMARLVNDSGVMGNSFKATAENVSEIPFDKVVEAIHKTQVEMGITGTTAEEASKTISGAFNSTKAAWENVLSAFGTGSNNQIKAAIDGLLSSAKNLANNIVAIIPNIINGIGTLISTLVAQLPTMLQAIIPPFTNILILAVQTIVTALPQFINAAIQLVIALVQGLADTMPQLIPQIISGITSMINTLTASLPRFLAAAVQVIVALVSGLAQAAPTLIPQIIDAALKMLDALLKQLPLLIDAGVKLLVAIVQGLADALPTLIKYIPQIVNTLITELTKPSVLTMLIKAALKIILAIAGGLIKAIPQLIAVVPQILSSLFKALGNIGASALNIGKNLLEGIWNGMKGAKDWLMDKVKNLTGAITDGIKSFFGIHSPSKVMRDEVGSMLGAGLAEGIDGSTKQAVESAGASAKKVLQAYGGSLIPKMPSSAQLSSSLNISASATVKNTSSRQIPIILQLENGDILGNYVIDAINNKAFMSNGPVLDF